eukprot:Amastigsp_a176605_4.p6 type:complete len:130 gc:universal Amastigsp_a176605_4:455-66(-)
MFSSAVVGRKEPFQTAVGFTRVLVLKASETWEAISDRRGPWTWPKPSARASGLLTTVSMAICRRRVSSVVLMMPSRALTSSIEAAGLAITSLTPLVKASRKALMAAGFSRIIFGEAMMTLPYSFTPLSA